MVLRILDLLRKGTDEEKTFIRHWPDQSRPVSDRVLRAQEDGASVADIGAKHDPRREKKI